jgi:hypothetical protein
MKPTSKEVINELCKILDATPKEIKGFMSPKEKAQDLYGKMRIDLAPILAKEIALIAVDEQISLLLSLSPYMAFPNQVTYLQEVKQEIEKL